MRRTVTLNLTWIMTDADVPSDALPVVEGESVAMNGQAAPPSVPESPAQNLKSRYGRERRKPVPYLLYASHRYSPRSLTSISVITHVSLSCFDRLLTRVQETGGGGFPDALQNKVIVSPSLTVKGVKG